jgi:hypothetical protein
MMWVERWLWVASSARPQLSHNHETSSLHIMHIDRGFWDVPQFLHEPLLYNCGIKQEQLFQESALVI